MNYKLITLVTLLILPISFFSCDENNSNGGPSPTPMPTPPSNCIELGVDPDALFDFEACPTDGLVMFCNGYGCNFYEGEIAATPPVFQGGTLFENCEVIDCFNIECEFFGSGEDMNPIGILTIDEILDNSNFQGESVFEEMGNFEYSCSPIIAN